MKYFIYILFLFFNVLYANNLEKVTLQLQWKHQFQFAGYYIAKEKGFYKDAGLDVEIKEFNYKINIVDEVVNNKAIYGTGRSSLLIDRSKGKPIKALAAIFQSSPLVLMTSAKSNIKTIQDLKGKSIMLSPDESTTVSINAMLNSQKISLKDMKRVKHTFKVDDLLDGKVDVSSAYISVQPYHFFKKSIHTVIFDPKDYGFDFYNDILFTSESEIKNHHKRAQIFKEASLKGWEYAFKHIDETIELILKKYNTQNKTKDELIYEANESKKLAYFNTDEIGKIDIKKIEKVYDIYKVMGYIKNEINLKDFIHKTCDKKFLSIDEKIYLLKKEKITMCIDPNWMPFEHFDKNGNYEGITADYFKLFEKILDKKFEPIKTKSWDESIKFAKKRKCDIFSLAMQTSERKKYMNFTTPYLSIPLVVATRIDVPFINDIKDLSNKKIGITKNYAFVEILKGKHPYLDVVEVKDIDEGLKKVSKGELFAYVGTLSSIGYKFQTNYFGELKIAGKLSDNWKLGIGVRNDDNTLYSILDKTVKSISNDEHRDILNKWLSIKYEKGIDYTIIWNIVIIFTIVLILLLYFFKKIHQKKIEFETIFKYSSDGIAITDLNTNFLDFNEAYCSITGYKKDELLSTSSIDLATLEHKKIMKKHISKVISGNNIDNYEKESIVKDGKRIILNMSISLLPDKKRLLIIVKDTTALKQIENQSKLISMGEMLGNIAHQWRQPLSVISTSASGLKFISEYEHELDKEFLKTSTNMIVEQTQYLSQTIDVFRDFIKGDTSLQEISLNETLHTALRLVDASLKNNYIKLFEDIDEDLTINANKHELEQAFINIINNSKDFLIEKVEDENDRIIKISTKKIGENKVEIKIIDSARGIEEKNLKRVFEPYFTTKHQSVGTGLGLSMVDKIIREKHNFYIDVHNEEFTHKEKKYFGACFTITVKQ